MNEFFEFAKICVRQVLKKLKHHIMTLKLNY